MGNFSLFVFFLCLIVFVALTTLLTILIGTIVNQQIKLIASGQEDEKILEENLKNKEKKPSLVWGILCKGCSILLLLLLSLMLVFSLIAGATGNQKVQGVPSFKVVSSTSMSFKNEKNDYLFDNGLNDQLQLLDLVIIHELPAEEDIELYDVIVYETREGVLVIHRIVGIEEPNDKHPNERWFQFKGDASDAYDRFPVKYEQMKGVYHGERIPNVGSFVFFMQSPAGILCFLLVIFSMIATPFAEKKLENAKLERVEVINAIKEEQEKRYVVVKACLIADKNEFNALVEKDKQNGNSVSYEELKSVAESGLLENGESLVDDEDSSQEE